MSIPTDVPIHRPSVGAMGWMGNQMPVNNEELFKRYVYRGTGEDQFPETAPPPPKRKPKGLAQNRKKPKRRREYDRWTQVRAQPLPHEPETDPEPWRDPELDRIAARPRTFRPAPGWRPTTGADLEELLEEIGP